MELTFDSLPQPLSTVLVGRSGVWTEDDLKFYPDSPPVSLESDADGSHRVKFGFIYPAVDEGAAKEVRIYWLGGERTQLLNVVWRAQDVPGQVLAVSKERRAVSLLRRVKSYASRGLRRLNH
jgi:hypothetical protein